MANEEYIDPQCSCQKMSKLERIFGKMPKGWSKYLWTSVIVSILVLSGCAGYSMIAGTFGWPSIASLLGGL